MLNETYDKIMDFSSSRNTQINIRIKLDNYDP